MVKGDGLLRERGRLATIIKTNSSWLILQPSSSSPPLIALYLNLYHNNVTLPRIYAPSSFSSLPQSLREEKLERCNTPNSCSPTWCYRVNRKMAYFVEHDAPGSDANRSRNYDQRESCLEMGKVCFPAIS